MVETLRCRKSPFADVVCLRASRCRSVKCFTPIHNTYTRVGIFWIFGYVLGVPALLLFLLYKFKVPALARAHRNNAWLCATVAHAWMLGVEQPEVDITNLTTEMVSDDHLDILVEALIDSGRREALLFLQQELDQIRGAPKEAIPARLSKWNRVGEGADGSRPVTADQDGARGEEGAHHMDKVSRRHLAWRDVEEGGGDPIGAGGRPDMLPEGSSLGPSLPRGESSSVHYFKGAPSGKKSALKPRGAAADPHGSVAFDQPSWEDLKHDGHASEAESSRKGGASGNKGKESNGGHASALRTSHDGGETRALPAAPATREPRSSTGGSSSGQHAATATGIPRAVARRASMNRLSGARLPISITPVPGQGGGVDMGTKLRLAAAEVEHAAKAEQARAAAEGLASVEQQLMLVVQAMAAGDIKGAVALSATTKAALDELAKAAAATEFIEQGGPRSPQRRLSASTMFSRQPRLSGSGQHRRSSGGQHRRSSGEQHNRAGPVSEAGPAAPPLSPLPPAPSYQAADSRAVSKNSSVTGAIGSCVAAPAEPPSGDDTSRARRVREGVQGALRQASFGSTSAGGGSMTGSEFDYSMVPLNSEIHLPALTLPPLSGGQLRQSQMAPQQQILLAQQLHQQRLQERRDQQNSDGASHPRASHPRGSASGGGGDGSVHHSPARASATSARGFDSHGGGGGSVKAGNEFGGRKSQSSLRGGTAMDGGAGSAQMSLPPSLGSILTQAAAAARMAAEGTTAIASERPSGATSVAPSRAMEGLSRAALQSVRYRLLARQQHRQPFLRRFVDWLTLYGIIPRNIVAAVRGVMMTFRTRGAVIRSRISSRGNSRAVREENLAAHIRHVKIALLIGWAWRSPDLEIPTISWWEPDPFETAAEALRDRDEEVKLGGEGAGGEPSGGHRSGDTSTPSGKHAAGVSASPSRRLQPHDHDTDPSKSERSPGYYDNDEDEEGAEEEYRRLLESTDEVVAVREVRPLLWRLPKGPSPCVRCERRAALLQESVSSNH